ncbi:hypothetical protein ON010_g2776 [Phytophthora cinnamomi]|nr:hypothetical protein ON010_g2776 [Phytophthora cinnamomi]
MVLLSLECAIVDLVGSSFDVKIDAGASVSALKYKIKEKKPDTITGEADKVQLFLAKTADGAWLRDVDPSVLALEEGSIHPDVQTMIDGQKMRATWTIEDVLKENHMTAPQSRQVHVLVVVPSSTEIKFTVTETTDEAALEELERYRRQGGHIKVKCTTYCNEILEKNDKYCDDTTEDTLPFLCVAGSSGMGKSQLAFALSGRRPYFYWLGMRISLNDQLLYRNFQNMSEAFISCVELDKPNKAEEKLVLDTFSSFYRTDFLWTYGLIRVLLNSRLEAGKMVHFGESTTLRVDKCDLAAVRAVVAELKEKEKKTRSRLLPFFILDEMAPDSSGGENAAAFQRNVFRVCRLVAMLMGTDTKITNLVNHARSSYTRCHQWMTVVPRFPSFQLKFFAITEKEIWQRIVEKYPVVETIVLQSRGRFSRYFIDEVLQKFQQDPNIVLCELLDAACARVSQASHNGKQFMNSPEGMYIQLMAISYTNAIGDVDMSVAIAAANPSIVGEPAQKKRRVHLKTPGMHKHFANLVDDKVTDVMALDALLGTKQPDWRMWQPMCSFTSIEDDLLLYLAILGGKDYPSYYNPIKRMHHSTKHIFSTTNPNEYGIHENTNAPVLDFKRYENMVAHAMC